MTANFKEYMGGLYLQRRLTHILLSTTFHWRDKLTVHSFALFYFARVNPLKLTPVDADKIMRCERDKMGWGGKAKVSFLFEGWFQVSRTVIVCNST